MIRAPGWESASGSASLPTRARRPRLETATSILPFSMKPMPPNIFTSRTDLASARARRTRAAISSGVMTILLVDEESGQLVDGATPALGVTLRSARAPELFMSNPKLRAGSGARDGDVHFGMDAGVFVWRLNDP